MPAVDADKNASVQMSLTQMPLKRRNERKDVEICYFISLAGNLGSSRFAMEESSDMAAGGRRNSCDNHVSFLIRSEYKERCGTTLGIGARHIAFAAGSSNEESGHG